MNRKYKQAKQKFLKILPRWNGEDPAYDALVVSLGRAEKDKTKGGEAKKRFIEHFEKYIN